MRLNITLENIGEVAIALLYVPMFYWVMFEGGAKSEAVMVAFYVLSAIGVAFAIFQILRRCTAKITLKEGN
ncbi:MAG: hypothetical protein CVT77_02015 [Alphaproteobacteria bacterium HGW-Alphaproteobacteria-16]|nr:MAG: hypothetical protein CVT77_02015 [Alphaproteobacteria bacterium HGW-Alphaproteobacteria-16]